MDNHSAIQKRILVEIHQASEVKKSDECYKKAYSRHSYRHHRHTLKIILFFLNNFSQYLRDVILGMLVMYLYIRE